MAIRLLCRVGRHAWERKVNDEGKPHMECARCERCAEPHVSGGSNFWGVVGGNS